MKIMYRALSAEDAGLSRGDAVVTGAPLAVTDDPGAATGSFAAEAVLVLLLEGEPLGDGDILPAGTRLTVVGERSMMHHLPSAVDIEIRALAVAGPDLAEEDTHEAFSHAMRRIGLALAAGAEGVVVPAQYGASIQAK